MISHYCIFPRLWFLLLVALSLCTACSDVAISDGLLEADEVGAPVAVQFSLPNYYRASATRSINDADLTPDLLRYFPDSSTMWLLVEQYVGLSESGDSLWKADDLNTAYAILTLTDDDGQPYRSDLVPCEVDEEGRIVSTQNTMLYLQPGCYRFRALWPALPLCDVVEVDSTYNAATGTYDYTYTQLHNVVEIDNGMQVCANYSANGCSKTAPCVVNIEHQSGGGIYRVSLNPLLNQVARLQFVILPDLTDATTARMFEEMVPLAEGCEISGLQGIDNFNWTASDPQPHYYLNNKNSKLAISSDAFTYDDESRSLSCVAYILPTNASSVSLFLSFNLRINGVPVQYMTSISKTVFEMGYSYNYQIKFRLNPDVTIASWVNVASSQVVPMQ